MPHYDLIDAAKMTEEQASLMCARLHLHGGKRRLREGLSAAGVAVLYDALLFGMRYFITRPEYCKGIDLIKHEDLWDPAALYHTLTKAGVFDDPYAFNHLSLTVERALWQESFSFDADVILATVEAMLRRLGVMQSSEAAHEF